VGGRAEEEDEEVALVGSCVCWRFLGVAAGFGYRWVIGISIVRLHCSAREWRNLRVCPFGNLPYMWRIAFALQINGRWKTPSMATAPVCLAVFHMSIGKWLMWN